MTGRDVGVRTEEDVLVARAQSIDAASKVADALRQYEMSRAELFAAAGSLDGRALLEIDHDLAPQ